MSDQIEPAQASALFLSAFFDELVACGVRDVVVSPGSRSTPLAMVAHASSMNLYVDIDERGAAFFALGLAKASGRPACVICTSGTAVANYYPAVLEAESSRVPLIVLTGDRPPRLQNLGAPQTCDQLKIYGDHVRHFQQMPLPASRACDIAFARQMGITAFCKAAGSPAAAGEHGQPFYGCVGNAGPVHFNFPFDEPLKPDLSVGELFAAGRRTADGAPVITASSALSDQQVKSIASLMSGRRTIALVGEGTCFSRAEAEDVLAWARRQSIPLLADPLSGLRALDDECVIDAYDYIFSHGEQPQIECVIRFGRYPVSKSCFTAVCASEHDGLESPVQIVVDAVDTRDFNAATSMFVRCEPVTFSRALIEVADPSEAQKAYLQEWVARNESARSRITRSIEATVCDELAIVAKTLELAPEGSLVFSANSLSIRLVDAVYRKSSKRLAMLCNRGLNGIDGTVSSALGAAQSYAQTTLVTGDLTMLHDLNALALQAELLTHHGNAEAPSIVVVLLNNCGGGIFETLPQKSDDPYFERLFITPQQIDFEHAARAFGVPYRLATTIDEFAEAYALQLGVAGISLIEIPFEIEGLQTRYDRYRRHDG